MGKVLGKFAIEARERTTNAEQNGLYRERQPDDKAVLNPLLRC